jgi:poly(3-hydroxybutyrate) depolymerase
MFLRNFCPLPLALTVFHLAGCSSGGGNGTASPPVEDAASPASDSGVSSYDASEATQEGANAVTCSPGVLCDGTTGLCAPNPACSTSSPCPEDGGAITTELPVTTCATCSGSGCDATSTKHPAFNDAPPETWVDAVTGDQRAACIFKPAGMSSASPRPLVIFVHGSLGYAQDLYDETLLRQKATNFDLSGDASRPGFVLVADQGRNLGNPNGFSGPGPRHDIYYRDFSSAAPTNPDVRAFDRLIDTLVAAGGIDTTRVYLAGWSNGAFFAQMYGILRHTTPTAGGNRVAAVVAYAGGSPYENLSDTQTPSCTDSLVPTSDLPIYTIHRNCDAAVACDKAQNSEFSQPPGYDVETWVGTLQSQLMDINVVDTIIDDNSVQQTNCQTATTCNATTGELNHLRWPDGIDDSSGNDWEPAMLQFLLLHPLS